MYKDENIFYKDDKVKMVKEDKPVIVADLNYDIKKITLIPINGIEAIFENGTSRRIETGYNDYYDESITELYTSIKPISSDRRYDWEKLGRAIRRMREIDLKNFYIIYDRG